MDGTDLEPDPRKRVPTALWWILSLILAAVFAALVFLLFGHGPPHVVGPPAGAPPGHD